MKALFVSLLLLVCGCMMALPGAASDKRLESLARDAKCTNCHDEMEAKPILSIYQTRHGVKADGRTPACQNCHGDSLAHANTPKSAQRFPLTDLPFGKTLPAAPQNEACLTCHQSNTARHWLGSQHERQGLACIACHTLHTPRDPSMTRSSQAKACFSCHQTERAQIHMPSAHPLGNGKLVCTDCHNPHGSNGPRLLVQDSINETCFTCHAEKRGPFLWEHAPASEDCSLCHTPHGSTSRPLLKLRSPWLCQQCHSSARHPSTAYSSTTAANTQIAASLNSAAQLPLHGCSNCHSQVHGSNHPGGGRLLR
jgi:DmsE family decaheme c-type cytochrome